MILCGSITTDDTFHVAHRRLICCHYKDIDRWNSIHKFKGHLICSVNHIVLCWVCVMLICPAALISLFDHLWMYESFIHSHFICVFQSPSTFIDPSLVIYILFHFTLMPATRHQNRWDKGVFTSVTSPFLSQRLRNGDIHCWKFHQHGHHVSSGLLCCKKRQSQLQFFTIV